MKSSKTRNFIVGGVAALVILAGGGAYAVASSSDGSSEKEEMLSKAETTKAKAAATARVNGQAVEVESEADYGGGYEVEVLRNDGSSVEVYLNKSFEVAGVEAEYAEGKEGEDYEDGEHGEYGGKGQEAGSKMKSGKSNQ